MRFLTRFRLLFLLYFRSSFLYFLAGLLLVSGGNEQAEAQLVVAELIQMAHRQFIENLQQEVEEEEFLRCLLFQSETQEAKLLPVCLIMVLFGQTQRRMYFSVLFSGLLLLEGAGWSKPSTLSIISKQNIKIQKIASMQIQFKNESPNEYLYIPQFLFHNPLQFQKKSKDKQSYIKFQIHLIIVTYNQDQHPRMKISNISSELKFVNRIGATLSVEQRISIESNALKLAHEYHYEQFNFWGRVEGIAKNYYVIEGVNFRGATSFPVRKYFWSTDDFKFAELPQPRKEFAEHVKTSNDFFTGQQEKILVKTQNEAPKIIKGPDGQEMIVKQKNFTQLDRLALLVSLVSHDCTVVPLGAYRMIPTHELVQNPDFRGLKVNQSKNPDNYLHLRAPEQQNKKILIQSDKALQVFDFMDSIESDQIKKSWSIQSDESGTEITIRSLVWPGYVGYHRTNSTVFGGVYMGNGIQVHDLAFLL